jgi:hypothetical protein
VVTVTHTNPYFIGHLFFIYYKKKLYLWISMDKDVCIDMYIYVYICTYIYRDIHRYVFMCIKKMKHIAIFLFLAEPVYDISSIESR